MRRLDLVNVAVPAHFQGKSLMPLAENRDITRREDRLFEYYEYPGFENVRPCRGVRTERYNYIHYCTDRQEFELYDLRTDPSEMRNLYRGLQQADLIRKLAARLQELRNETGDHFGYTPTVPL